MRVVFLPRAWTHYQYWVEHDRTMLRRLNRTIDECVRSPFAGLNKPEPLKAELSGWWSRRIDREHRLVYRVDDEDLIIAQCRFHYDP